MSSTKSRGSMWYIGTTAANATTDTYTEMPGMKVSGGTIGKTFNEIDDTKLTDDYIQRVKGQINLGAVEFTWSVDAADAGQAAFTAAVDEGEDDTPYNFRWVASTGYKIEFKGRAFSDTATIGSGANLLEGRGRVLLSTPPIHTPPA